MWPLWFGFSPFPIAKWGERAQGRVGEPEPKKPADPKVSPPRPAHRKPACRGHRHKKAAWRGLCALISRVAKPDACCFRRESSISASCCAYNHDSGDLINATNGQRFRIALTQAAPTPFAPKAPKKRPFPIRRSGRQAIKKASPWARFVCRIVWIRAPVFASVILEAVSST